MCVKLIKKEFKILIGFCMIFIIVIVIVIDFIYVNLLFYFDVSGLKEKWVVIKF